MNYINHRNEIETALRLLESFGHNTVSIWRAHTARLEETDNQKMPESDKFCTYPVQIPFVIDHLPDGQNEVLTQNNLWVGYSYQLSPGQRLWLKERYNMTPTATVTITECGLWPETQHPKMIRLESDLHVDPRHRAHVLKAVNITSPGQFFKDAIELDSIIEAEKPRRGVVVGEKTYEDGRFFLVDLPVVGQIQAKTAGKLLISTNDEVLVKWSHEDDSWKITKRLTEKERSSGRKTKTKTKIVEDYLALLDSF